MSESSYSRKPSFDSLRSGSVDSILDHEPERLPPRVDGPIAWEGKEIDSYEFVLALDKDEIQAIRHAVVAAKLSAPPRKENDDGVNTICRTITKSTFELPVGLAAKLKALSDDIHNGRGIAIVRGLGAANFNDAEAIIAFVGVCAHVCPLRATDSYANQTMNHVRDASYDKHLPGTEDMGLAGSKLPVPMEFHCDRFSGDVLAMHVRNEGKNTIGGEQFVSSFATIYNELLDTEPAVLDTLAAADWPFELKQGDNIAPNLELGPTLFFANGKPIIQLVNAPLKGGAQLPRDKTMPNLSAEQIHAGEVVEELARKHCVQLDRQQGDIQFINNLGIMHARSSYKSTIPMKPADRHFLRMFLRDPENEWAKPRSYQSEFDNAFIAGRPENFPFIDFDPWRIISGRESHG